MKKIRGILRNIIPLRHKKSIIKIINSHGGNYLNRLIYGKATYNQDGLLTVHNADFMHEPRFAAAYAAGQATGSWTYGDLHWRAYIVCWAANRGASLPGDFVECGVNRGGYALTVIKYLNFELLPKKFYLLDTYEGLVERYILSEEKARGIIDGEYEPCYDAVQRTFAPYKNVEIIKGAVPDTLHLITTDRISFLSIDMNTLIPEIAAAEYFWEKLAKGAVIVLDDYGWRKHYEQKTAFDEFARKRGVMILSLPTGQGLIFKP